MWKLAAAFLILIPVSGCFKPCADGDCTDKILLQSASRDRQGDDHPDLIVYCDGSYKYNCPDCNWYAGKLGKQRLSNLKYDVTSPFKFNHADGIAHYWYRQNDIQHRDRILTMAEVYKFAQGQFLSEPNQIRKTLSVLKLGMSQGEVKTLLPNIMPSIVVKPKYDVNDISVLYYSPSGGEPVMGAAVSLMLLSAIAGTNKDAKEAKEIDAVFQVAMYCQMTSKRIAPLIFKNDQFVGWGWAVYDQYLPRQKTLNDMYTPERRKVLDKACEKLSESGL